MDPPKTSSSFSILLTDWTNREVGEKMKSEIVSVYAEYKGVQLRMVTSKGDVFSLLVSPTGLIFDSFNQPLSNSDFATSGRPIKKSVDELFDWIADEGSKKPFRDRKNVKRLKRSIVSDG